MALPIPVDGRIEGLTDDPDIRTLIHVLARNEDRRNRTYLDSEGIPTVGIGFNLERADAPVKVAALGLNYDDVVAGRQTLSDAQIDRLLADDLVTAIGDARDLLADFDSLITARQIVLVDMAFNLGKPRLANFRKMIAAINARDWDEAAAQMMDSRWYRQVKTRGDRNVTVMKTGTLVADYVLPGNGGNPTVA